MKCSWTGRPEGRPLRSV